MKVRVIWFGKESRPIKDQVETYRKRISMRWAAEEIQLKPFLAGRDYDPRRTLSREADSARKVIPAGSIVLALDEGGKPLTSTDFAKTIERIEQNGGQDLVFVIGSDLGLDKKLRSEARLTLSLSAMTLPHQLARLLLWEQLFRATHILGGGSYHRSSIS